MDHGPRHMPHHRASMAGFGNGREGGRQLLFPTDCHLIRVPVRILALTIREEAVVSPKYDFGATTCDMKYFCMSVLSPTLVLGLTLQRLPSSPRKVTEKSAHSWLPLSHLPTSAEGTGPSGNTSETALGRASEPLCPGPLFLVPFTPLPQSPVHSVFRGLFQGVSCLLTASLTTHLQNDPSILLLFSQTPTKPLVFSVCRSQCESFD